MSTNKKTKKSENVSPLKNMVDGAVKINRQVQFTAEEVAKEVLENTKKVRNATKKAAKEIAENVDFETSAKQIRYTTQSVNNQLKGMATEAIDAVQKSGQQMAMVAIKATQDTLEQVDLEKRVQKIRTTAKNVNDYSLKTADEVIDGAVKNGERWQKIATKAIKGSMKLAEKNQEIVFGTLEEVKDQMMTGVSRFKKLFSKN